jgi:hypothetical protein
VSDFLLDLARRSLGLAPVVRPIPPTLFEPVGSTEMGAGWGGEVTREVASDRPPIVTRTESAPPAGREPGAIESTRVERVVERQPAAIQPAAAQPPTLPPPPATPLTSAGRTESTEDRPPGFRVSGPAAAGTEIVRERTEHIREERTREHHEVEVRAERTIVRDLPAVARTPALAPAPPAEPKREPVVPRRADPAAVTLPAALPRAMPEPARERLQPDSSEASIRVHIGRVEVRAVFPPATAAPDKPRPAAPPVMPLDEYLKQRGGRG